MVPPLVSNSSVQIISVQDHREWLAQFPKLAKALLENKNPQILEVIIESTAAGATFAEVRAPAGTVFDGEATPVAVAIKSAEDEDDNDATDWVRQAIVTGWDEDDAITTETLTLDGVTLAPGSTLWKRLFNFQSAKWGTGGNVAKGAIAIRNLGDTLDHMVIGAGENLSEGAALWVPTGKKATLLHMYAFQTTQNAAANLSRLRWLATTSVATEPGLEPENNELGLVLGTYRPYAAIKNHPRTYPAGTKLTPQSTFVTAAESTYWVSYWVFYTA